MLDFPAINFENVVNKVRLHENAENADRSKSPPLTMFLGPVLHEESIAAISGGCRSVSFRENDEKPAKFVYFLIIPSL